MAGILGGAVLSISNLFLIVPCSVPDVQHLIWKWLSEGMKREQFIRSLLSRPENTGQKHISRSSNSYRLDFVLLSSGIYRRIQMGSLCTLQDLELSWAWSTESSKTFAYQGDLDSRNLSNQEGDFIWVESAIVCGLWGVRFRPCAQISQCPLSCILL